jgi:hypothetical protein
VKRTQRLPLVGASGSVVFSGGMGRWQEGQISAGNS